ncbi:HisF Imidazoleglycerol-phosphate synthase [Candidatus Nanopelagicaceae bacterium]
MFENRTIPILTIDGNDLVKTTKFKNPRYVGDPLNVVRIFNNKEVDELIILDITISMGSEINYPLLEQLAEECNMPLTYGGGISDIRQVDKIFELGFEKVLVRRGIEVNRDLVSQITTKYGRQSLILGIDLAVEISEHEEVITDKLSSEIRKAIELGAGEVFINDQNRDGTLSGARHEIIREVSVTSDIPIIWAGGFNSLDDIQNGFLDGLSAVGVGAFFCYYGKFNSVLITYPIKNETQK